MVKGITNLESNKFFEKEENQYIKNNYMGVYSMDSITRYINFYEIIKKEIENICLIPINTISLARTGGFLWILTPAKKIFCYLIVLD